jgi:Cell shape-determining protein
MKIIKENKEELKNFQSKEILNQIIISENDELKKLIEDFTFTRNKILAKVIVDHDSPFSKTIIINKGSKDGLKIGTNIFDKNYLIGRVIETNFKTSRYYCYQISIQMSQYQFHLETFKPL